MSEPFVFDSRCELCKYPFGAVPHGTHVLFHVRPLAREGFTHCALVIQAEFARYREERDMTFGGFEGDRVRFDVTYPAPGKPELIWYHFRFWRDDGSGCTLDRNGYRSDGEPLDW
jgi:cyclomaltodextrinase